MAETIQHRVLKRLEWAHELQRLGGAEVRNNPQWLKLLGPETDPSLDGWRHPDKRMVLAAVDPIIDSFMAIRAGGPVSIPTGFTDHPSTRLVFKEPKASESMIAPLTMLCTDACQREGLWAFLEEAHSPFTRRQLPDATAEKHEIFGGDAYYASGLRDLMARLNQFLAFEAKLWSIARERGFDGTVPYPVRYYAAAYLWSPLIAGHAFCLRCGNLISYKKAGRPGKRTAPVCDRCLQSGIGEWPAHALMPESRGKWSLTCQRPQCASPFVGAGQARFCPEHRSNRLTQTKR